VIPKKDFFVLHVPSQSNAQTTSRIFSRSIDAVLLLNRKVFSNIPRNFSFAIFIRMITDNVEQKEKTSPHQKLRTSEIRKEIISPDRRLQTSEILRKSENYQLPLERIDPTLHFGEQSASEILPYFLGRKPSDQKLPKKQKIFHLQE